MPLSYCTYSLLLHILSLYWTYMPTGRVEGEFLDFQIGVLMSRNFLGPPNNQTSISKTTNNQLSTQNVQTGIMFWVHKSIKPEMTSPVLSFRPHISTFRTSKFQTPYNLPCPKFQTQKKHKSTPPFQTSWSLPLAYMVFD